MSLGRWRLSVHGVVAHAKFIRIRRNSLQHFGSPKCQGTGFGAPTVQDAQILSLEIASSQKPAD
jgi:hypothetical protein